MEYFEEMFRERFGEDVLTVIVTGWPSQAHVEVVVKRVSPQMTEFANSTILEFAELDRLIDIDVRAE